MVDADTPASYNRRLYALGPVYLYPNGAREANRGRWRGPVGCFPLDCSTSRNEVDEEDNDSDDQQEVNQATGHVEHPPPQKPGNQQDYREPDQHEHLR